MEYTTVWIHASGLEAAALNTSWINNLGTPSYEFQRSTVPSQPSYFRIAGLLMSLVFSVLLSTYLVTWYRYKLASLDKKTGKDAPMLPYWVPFLGHGPGFAWNAGHAVNFFASQCTDYKPVSIKLWKTQMYFITGAQNIRAIFSNDRTTISAKEGPIHALKVLFPVPKQTIALYEADDSGVGAQPQLGSTVHPDHRVYHALYKISTETLSGSSMQPIADRFMVKLFSLIQESKIGQDWVAMSDLSSFIKEPLFQAAVESICGPHLFALNPNLAQDFWAFDKEVVPLCKGYPRWLIPGSWKARDKCVEAMRKWNQHAREHFKTEEPNSDAEFEPFLGTRFVRARREFYSKLEAFTDDAIDVLDLGAIWATNSNTIPALLWCLIEAERDPYLLSRLRSEISSTICSGTSADLRFDYSQLGRQPLLQSVYAEVLRLRLSLFSLRSAQGADFQLGDYTLRQDQTIMISSYTSHMDPTVWNTGTNDDPHPIDEFWAERFLVYPDDPSSGPLKKAVPAPQEHASLTSVKDNGNTGEQPAGPRFSTKGLSGIFIPYGGGSRLCPGRHFAKQEILLGLAYFLTAYDFQLNVPSGWKAEQDLTVVGTGTLPPKDKIPFSVRRRDYTI